VTAIVKGYQLTSNVISLIQAGRLPYEILLELPYRNKRIGNVLPPLPVNSWPIEELNISTRSKNCLTRHSINFLSEICDFTFRELADIRFFGLGSFDEIISEYIGKIGLVYGNLQTDVPIVDIPVQNRTKSVSDFSLALEYIIKNIGRREASIIRNSLSQDKMKISDLSEIWGISRQRSYQIVDKLQEDIINLPYFTSLASSCMGSWESSTIAEVLQRQPYLALGRAETEFSISILDLLFYSGHLNRIENYMVVTPKLSALNLHELFVYSFEHSDKSPELVSPQVLKMSSDFVKNQNGIQISSGFSGDFMLEAEDWANNLDL
jgi:hypothetical protein